MAGPDLAGRTGRSCRESNSSKIESDLRRLRLHTWHREEGRVRQPRCLLPMDDCARHLLPDASLNLVPLFAKDFDRAQLSQRLPSSSPKACNTRHVLRSCAMALLLTAAFYQWCRHEKIRCTYNRAHPLGATDLVRGNYEEVCVTCCDIERYSAHR